MLAAETSPMGEPLTKRQRRLRQRVRRNRQAALAVRSSRSVLAAIDELIVQREAERSRQHRRPEVEVAMLDLVRDRLTEREYRAGQRLAELWWYGGMGGRSITASYGAQHGSGEMSDRRADAHAELGHVMRAMRPFSGDAIGLACFDERRALEAAREGLRRAADWWGM